MPLRPGHIKPSVQPLAISVSALIPNICKWYGDTPDTETKRQIANKVAARYNDLVFKFNRDLGTTYQFHRPGILRIWVRNHPTDRAVCPYLHEVMILAKAWREVVPDILSDAPVANYREWIIANFAPAYEALQDL